MINKCHVGFVSSAVCMCVYLPCSPERKEDVTYASNYLVFGHGPHYCVGKEYANNHLIAFLAILSTTLDWTRTRWGARIHEACLQDLTLLSFRDLPVLRHDSPVQGTCKIVWYAVYVELFYVY